MSGDLEDFLRRAAQRRQAKSAQQPQPQAARPKPEYSNRRTERVVDAVIVEEPMVAEIVAEDTRSFAAQQRRLRESQQQAARAKADAAAKLSQLKQRHPFSSGGRRRGAARVVLTGVTSQDLIRLLATPQGIRQAILLREVLERPEHRW